MVLTQTILRVLMDENQQEKKKTPKNSLFGSKTRNQNAFACTKCSILVVLKKNHKGNDLSFSVESTSVLEHHYGTNSLYMYYFIGIHEVQVFILFLISIACNSGIRKSFGFWKSFNRHRSVKMIQASNSTE